MGAGEVEHVSARLQGPHIQLRIGAEGSPTDQQATSVEQQIRLRMREGRIEAKDIARWVRDGSQGIDRALRNSRGTRHINQRHRVRSTVRDAHFVVDGIEIQIGRVVQSRGTDVHSCLGEGGLVARYAVRTPGSREEIAIAIDGYAVDKRLNTEVENFEDWSQILFDQALLAEGGQLEDPAAFVKRLDDLLLLKS